MSAPPLTPRRHASVLTLTLTLCLVLVLAGLGPLGLSGPIGVASAQTPITGCTTITHPGTYELTQNITNATPADRSCIEIQTSDVVFDGNGFTIDGIDAPDTPVTAGVSVESGPGFTNVTVRNLTVTDWDNGIRYRRVSDGAIHETTTQNNDLGIRLVDSSNTTITTNTIRNNYRGIVLTSSANNTIANNTITQNTRAGIGLFGSSTNLIYNNRLNNAENVNIVGASANTWNVSRQPGPNIIGGPFLGGNYYATPNGTGYSQTCSDANSDSFCDQPNTVDGDNIDHLPLTQPPPTSRSFRRPSSSGRSPSGTPPPPPSLSPTPGVAHSMLLRRPSPARMPAHLLSRMGAPPSAWGRTGASP